MEKTIATYGSIVDAVDAVDAEPATATISLRTLPNHNNGAADSFEVGGNWSTPVSSSVGGDYVMV